MTHSTMLVVNNGKNHVECRCGWSNSAIAGFENPSVEQFRLMGKGHVTAMVEPENHDAIIDILDQINDRSR